MSETDPRDRLGREAHLFEFFQAVRLLERGGRTSRRSPVGEDGPPDAEAVRFTSVPSLSYAAAPVRSVRTTEDSQTPAEMQVTFFGLTGPAGALPHHYTATVIAEERGKQGMTRAFFDLFVHRLVSLFYRAWQKYRLPVTYERVRSVERGEGAAPWQGLDPFTSMLLSLAGMCGTGNSPVYAATRELLAFYAGQYARRPRSAVGLASVLSDCFGVPVSVEQFRGKWLRLDEGDRSRLGCGPGKEGYCSLGRSLVLGRQVWEVQSSFRVRMGPMDCDQFRHFLPRSEGLRLVGQLTRLYAGAEFDFDVQPVLAAGHVPRCRLGQKGGRLGRDFWVASEPARRDFEGRAFTPDV